MKYVVRNIWREFRLGVVAVFDPWILGLLMGIVILAVIVGGIVKMVSIL